MTKKRTLLCAIVLALAVIAAWAADKPRVIDGSVESVNQSEHSFVVKDKKTGESVVVKDEGGKIPIHIYTKGTKDDVTDGADVKVYGKIAPDMTAVNEVYSICVMPSPSTVTDKKARIDGKLVVKDGKWFVQGRGPLTEMSLKNKVDYQKVFGVDFGFIEPGIHMRVYGDKKDGTYQPKWDMRGYTDRDKVEAYVAKMAKDK